MNAYKEWQEGNITQAEYNSICTQEAMEYAEQMERKWNDEEVFEEDDIEDY